MAAAPAAAAAVAAIKKKDVVRVHLCHVDPSGRRQHALELWLDTTEEDRAFIEHCANNEKGRWNKRVLDQFANLRMKCWDPDATLKGSVIIEDYYVTIHYDNDDLMEEETEEEDQEASEEEDE